MLGWLHDIPGVAIAWARFAPTIALVPAFAMRGYPAALRGVIGLALAVCILPAIRPLEVDPTLTQTLLLMAESAMRGVPIAIATAVPLWAATMAGGIIDTFRGAPESSHFPFIDGDRNAAIGTLFTLLASSFFFASGAPSRVAAALIAPTLAQGPLSVAVHDLTAGISLAVSLAAPLFAATMVIEVAAALIARAAAPAQLFALIAPLRAVAILAITALAFQRISDHLAVALNTIR